MSKGVSGKRGKMCTNLLPLTPKLHVICLSVVYWWFTELQFFEISQQFKFLPIINFFDKSPWIDTEKNCSIEKINTSKKTKYQKQLTKQTTNHQNIHGTQELLVQIIIIIINKNIIITTTIRNILMAKNSNTF